ncbi:hypothetical protein QBC38DRAFT_343779, partial [Podospora fimiseda]
CASVAKWEETTVTSVPRTLITVISSNTITILSPTESTPTSFPATIIPTLIFSYTAEYRMTFVDGQSSTSWTS